MKRPLALAFLLLAAVPGRAALKDARAKLNAGDASGAVAEYAAGRATRHPELAAEYAYALALAGFKDLSLGHLDQALALLNKQQPEKSATVNFFAARVFATFGYDEIAQELSAQAGSAPAWLKPEAGAGVRHALEKAAVADFSADLSVGNSLLLQKRYYTAADRFQKLVVAYPTEPGGYAGFAVALERIGAYRKASRAVAKSIELGKAKLTPEQVASQTSYQKELESRPQAPPSPSQAARNSLKGRYLAFLGGNLNRTKQSTVSSVNARLGKFLTNRVDVSLTAGYTGGNINKDYRGASVGLGGRYSQPLSVSAPLNITSGARVQYNPRPSKKTSVIVSPGLSWVLDSGSMDLVLDYGVSGPLEESTTVSVGFTTYFGGGR